MIVTKKQIEEVIFNGGKIHWCSWDAKASLIDEDENVIGTIRFDTYLQLDLREIEMKLPLRNPDGTINSKSSPFRRLHRPDAWCGYDEYKLKDEVVSLCSRHSNMKTYFVERIWR